MHKNDYRLWPRRNYSKHARLVQHSKINHCNLPKSWAREENLYENIVGAENKFDKVQFPFTIKPQGTKNNQELLHLDKEHLWRGERGKLVDNTYRERLGGCVLRQRKIGQISSLTTLTLYSWYSKTREKCIAWAGVWLAGGVLAQSAGSPGFDFHSGVGEKWEVCKGKVKQSWFANGMIICVISHRIS